MDLLFQQLFGLLEQFSSEDHGGSGSISNLGVLSLGNLYHHLGGRVLNIHFFEDGDAVIGYYHVSHGIYQHLVHALGAESGSYGTSHGLGGHDIRSLCLSSSSSLAAFPKYVNRAPVKLSCQLITSITIQLRFNSYS